MSSAHKAPDVTRWIGGKPKVLEIDDATLAALLARFTPLVSHEGQIWRIKTPDARRQAYTWDPERIEPVKFTPVRAMDIDHSCGYIAFFKPSIAEVLAKVAELEQFDLFPPECNAFWTDIDSVLPFNTGEAHRATTHFGTI